MTLGVSRPVTNKQVEHGEETSVRAVAMDTALLRPGTRFQDS
jgi:hypothetical protein